MGVLNISPKMPKAVLITTLTTIKNEKFWRAFSFCCSPIWLETSAQPPVAIIVPIASAMAGNGPAMLTAESVSVPKMLDTKIRSTMPYTFIKMPDSIVGSAYFKSEAVVTLIFSELSFCSIVSP